MKTPSPRHPTVKTLDKLRWRARGLVIEKPHCHGYYLHAHGATRAEAKAEFRRKTAGFYSADTNRLEFRDRGPAR